MRDEIMKSFPKFDTPENLKEFVKEKKQQEVYSEDENDSETEEEYSRSLINEKAMDIKLSMKEYRDDIINSLNDILEANKPDRFTLSDFGIKDTLEKFEIACNQIDALIEDIKVM